MSFKHMFYVSRREITKIVLQSKYFWNDITASGAGGGTDIIWALLSSWSRSSGRTLEFEIIRGIWKIICIHTDYTTKENN